MKPWRVKSFKAYKGPFVLDADRVLAAMKRYKDVKRKPTSVALEERTVQELKALAKQQGIPYQVLMRIFIMYGLEAMKKAS